MVITLLTMPILDLKFGILDCFSYKPRLFWGHSRGRVSHASPNHRERLRSWGFPKRSKWRGNPRKRLAQLQRSGVAEQI